MIESGILQYLMSNTSYQRARELIDAIHSADPCRDESGCAEELIYADRVEAWVARLVPAAPALLRLAARCQHLERWAVPRSSFPPGKAGYHAWRKTLYHRQAERARELLISAGVSVEEADEVALWVSKTNLKTNAGSQALEDAAVLVFLEHQVADFAAQHEEYPPEKFVRILSRTWGKLSPAARESALSLELPGGISDLLQAAIEEDSLRSR